MYQDCERWLRFWINIDKIWDNIVWSKRVVAKVEMSPSLPSPPSTSYFGSARKERCKEGVRIGKLWPIFSILHRRWGIISPFWRLIHHQHRNDEGEMSSSISSPPSTLYSGSARKQKRCEEGTILPSSFFISKGMKRVKCHPHCHHLPLPCLRSGFCTIATQINLVNRLSAVNKHCHL